jgi:hypothetical protein
MLAWLLSVTAVLSLAQAEGVVPTAPAAAEPAAVVAPASAPAPESIPMPAPEPAAAPEPTPAPAGVVSPLTGLACDPALAQRNPLMVMVENTRAARPQSGMDQAEVVIEVHVEGGVTRFTNFFVCTDAEVIGPVRSTRQVFASWAKSVGAWLSHCWAKPSGYAMIEKLGVRNIDGVRPRGAKTPFYRVETRKGPHNLYTSTAELRRYAEDRGYEPHPLVPFFQFKDPAPVTPTHTWIGLDFNGVTYFSHFEYDASTNRYLRFLAGDPHVVGSTKAKKPAREKLDGAPHAADSAAQLTVDNLLVLLMKERVAGDGGVLDITTTGRGAAYLYRDGTRVEGTWVRAKEDDGYEFLTADGTPLLLNRGTTWIAILPNEERLLHAVPKTFAKSIDGPVAVP